MDYFVIRNPKVCISLLSQGSTTCGVDNYRSSLAAQYKENDWTPEVRVPTHYVGNYWWARCDYVATLPPPDQGCVMCGEFWLLSKMRGGSADPRIAEVFTSGVNFYEEAFPPEAYESFYNENC